MTGVKKGKSIVTYEDFSLFGKSNMPWKIVLTL